MVYKGWDSSLISMNSEILNEILLYSHLDVNKIDSEESTSLLTLDNEIAVLEEELNIEEVKKITTPLNIDKRCNICSIINLCLRYESDKLWLYDYCLLCYKCNYAPKTPLSILIIATEFMQLIRKHFTSINFDGVFINNILSVFDFHVHFFINRCFATAEDLLHNENITLNHMTIIKSLLLKNETIPNLKLKKLILKKGETRKKDNSDLLEKLTIPLNTHFTDLIFYMWSGTNVFDRTSLTSLATKKRRFLKSICSTKDDFNSAAGPILLSHIPVSITKNTTTTVCLLCELMTSSKQNHDLVKFLYDSIVNYCQNNLKMIDRVQFVLADVLETSKIHSFIKTKSDRSKIAISNEHSFSNSEFVIDCQSYLILKQVGPIGLYKHFFCDPLCIANSKTINPNILFYTTENCILHDFKVTICYQNEYLTVIEKYVWLAIHYFKAFQIYKLNQKNKTLMTDFLKDFIQLLSEKKFEIVDPTFTINYYV
ncbi:DNA packaging protein UL32 [macacine betaherpesvirus 9]|uniref:Packaging protein UL32 n=1 Tax=macacine betaherpesvirus 9 TaxID=2560568 RepID=A0A191S3T7_9BETA|nr:DNA packaging protein UL32 [macacine betaherpesvirus 9]ANC96544.1 DNA packaging protein UL32 [macacine betaherpesvirus 9]